MSLIKRIKNGDKEAMGELVKRELPKLFTLSVRLCQNKTDASDLCQDVFVKALNSIGQFREEANVSTWLYRITINTWKNRVRSEKRRHFASHFSLFQSKNKDEGEETAIDLPSNDPSPEQQSLINEQQRELLKSLDKLQPDEKSLIVLRDIEGNSYEALSHVFGVNIGTIKSRLSRARHQLREIHLRAEGKVI